MLDNFISSAAIFSDIFLSFFRSSCIKMVIFHFGHDITKLLAV